MIPERAEAAGGGGGEGGEGGGGDEIHTAGESGGLVFLCVCCFVFFVLPVRCSLLSGVLLAPRGGKKINKKNKQKKSSGAASLRAVALTYALLSLTTRAYVPGARATQPTPRFYYASETAEAIHTHTALLLG